MRDMSWWKRTKLDAAFQNGRAASFLFALASLMLILTFLVVIIPRAKATSLQTPLQEEALLIDDERYSAEDISFYVYQVFRSWYAYCEQTYGDGAFVRQLFDDDALLDAAIQQAVETKLWYEDAQKNGFDTADAEKLAQQFIEDINVLAQKAGVSYEQYLTHIFGDGFTSSCFERQIRRSATASLWRGAYMQSFQMTLESCEAYYATHRDSFTYVDYDQLFFYVQENGMSDAAACVAAEQAYAAIQAGEDMASVSARFPEASLSHNENTIRNISPVFDWLFSTDRNPGDTTLIRAENTAYYILSFLSAYRNEYETLNIVYAQIPISNDAEQLASHSALRPDEGRDIANNVLELWRQRGSAESALLELLEALPSPIHSKTYSRLQKGKLDQGADDWLFDSQREAGDYTILENSSAITIIYISGRDLPCWQAQVEQAASEEQCGQYLEDMKASCSVMCLSGLNHVIDYLNDTYLAHKQVQ